MLQTIKTLSQFKAMATLTHDNREIASKNWAKTWGRTWWWDVWFYKEYSIGCLKYRTGKAHYRHYSESIVKFYINDDEISRAKFFELASTIEYRPKNVIVNTQSKPKQHQQLSLF